MCALVRIVEENPVSAKVLELTQAQHGYETMLAQTANAALEYLQYAPNTPLSSTDLVMPEMDGFEFLQTIKRHPLRQEIPVIMATSLADVDSIMRAFAMGCRSNLVKPIRAAQLLQKVHDVLDPEKPILHDQLQVMLELAVNLATYRQMAQIFAEPVGEKLAELAGQLVGEYVEGLLPSVRDLSEGAAFLGAERVLGVIEGLSIKGERISENSEQVNYPMLLKELKLL